MKYLSDQDTVVFGVWTMQYSYLHDAYSAKRKPWWNC